MSKEVSNAYPHIIVVVDDDPTMLEIIERFLQHLDYEVKLLDNCKDAYDFIKSNKDDIQTIVLDRNMPNMSGLELTRLLKEDDELSGLPVVMITGSDKPCEIKEGIDAGVFYYLTKPLDKNLLDSIISAASRERKHSFRLDNEMKKHQLSFKLVEDCTFKLRNLEESSFLASFVAQFFPNPMRVALGISELIINAIEHGNLNITYNEKTQLLKEGTWSKEITRRLNLPEHKDKFVHVTFRRTDTACKITITDMGNGFEWKKFLEIDATRLTDNHGRGIAQSKIISFDNLSYNEKGNSVTAEIFVNSNQAC